MHKYSKDHYVQNVIPEHRLFVKLDILQSSDLIYCAFVFDITGCITFNYSNFGYDSSVSDITIVYSNHGKHTGTCSSTPLRRGKFFIVGVKQVLAICKVIETSSSYFLVVTSCPSNIAISFFNSLF